jgi:hypothetical protein
MRSMEHPPRRPHGGTPGGTTTAVTDTAERTPGSRHFQSLILPGLVSVPPMPTWLSKLFRRKDTPAAH